MIATVFVTALMAVMACAPSDADQIAAINAELDDVGVLEYCDVSIGTSHGEVAYIIDTDMHVENSEEGYQDMLLVFSTVLGCVTRAIPSDEGYLRVGFRSLWACMDMTHAHECLRSFLDGDDNIAAYRLLNESIEFEDR